MQKNTEVSLSESTLIMVLACQIKKMSPNWGVSSLQPVPGLSLCLYIVAVIGEHSKACLSAKSTCKVHKIQITYALAADYHAACQHPNRSKHA